MPHPESHRWGSVLRSMRVCLRALVLAALLSTSAHAAEAPPVRLDVGAVATLFARELVRYEVDDAQLIKVVRKDRLNLRLHGRRPGQTRLRTWNAQGEVNEYQVIVASKPAQAASADRSGNRTPETTVSDGQTSPGPSPELLDLRPETGAPDPSDMPASAYRPLDLFVGAVATEQVGAIQRLVVGNDEVAQASLLEDGELLVLGRSPGITQLQVMNESGRLQRYQVRVYAAPPEDAQLLLQTALRPFPDIDIEARLGRLILTGSVDLADFERFETALRDFPGVLSTVTPQLNIEIEPTVVLDVSVLEVNRTYQKTIGVRWQDTGPGPVTGVVGNLIPNSDFGVVSPSGDLTGNLEQLLGAVGSGSQKLSAYLGITSIIGSELQFLQEEGLARVLAAPSLSTVSGEAASFLAGGDFPVAILNQFGQPVIEFREFGVQLEIEPVVDRMLNVRSRIRAEVSSVDFTTQVNGVPGLLRRETVSTITARPGDTIILSGLLDARDSRNVDKVPGLGSIPIIGQLFRSDDFIKQRTELIITVTPRIQAPNTALSPTLAAADRHLRNRLLRGSKGIDRALILADAPAD